MLLSEVSSSKSRGAVGSVHQIMINLGILSSGLFGYALVEDVNHGWRYIQAFIAVPAIAQVSTRCSIYFILFIFYIYIYICLSSSYLLVFIGVAINVKLGGVGIITSDWMSPPSTEMEYNAPGLSSMCDVVG